jgi:hypothetical protein
MLCDEGWSIFPQLTLKSETHEKKLLFVQKSQAKYTLDYSLKLHYQHNDSTPLVRSQHYRVP